LPVTKRLHINFAVTHGWALPIISAADANPTLAEPRRRWRASPLSDLAFSIETRLAALDRINSQLGEHLRALSHALPTNSAELAPYLTEPPRAFTLKDTHEVAFRRFLIALDAFVSESRSLFENLATFHRLFVCDYFNEVIPQKQQYTYVISLFPRPELPEKLRTLRHQMRHGFAPWLGFFVQEEPLLLEPELQLDWRPEVTDPD
jgi:hypothetical protein